MKIQERFTQSATFYKETTYNHLSFFICRWGETLNLGNTLMIVLALYYRGEIGRERCGSLLASLKLFAHYGENVWACGRQLWEELCGKND